MSSSPERSAYLLENLMSNVPDAIYFKDRDSRFIMMNQACLRRHGWSALEDMVGQTDFDLFTKEHAEQAYADEQRIIATGEPLYGVEEMETWPDGRITWASTTKMPLKNEKGEIIGTFGISRDITRRKEFELHAQQAAGEIRIIKEEMESDFRMAGELQKSFFPSSYPVFPAGAEPADSSVTFLHDFKACGDVGGDYCSVHRVSETEAGIFLCDVEGIGVRSALGTALIRGIVQETSPLGLDPGAYLSRMNDVLVPLMCQNEALFGVTACYLLLDTATGNVRFSNAGLPLPIRFREGNGAEQLCRRQEPCGPALAAESGFVYATAECQVEAGDTVVLYTDGLCKVKNAKNELYGVTRLLEAAQSLAGESLAAIFKALETEALAFSLNGRFSDDVCLVGFQLRGPLQ